MVNLIYIFTWTFTWSCINASPKTSVEHLEQARQLMSETPLIDTHIDLPQIMRSLSREPLRKIPEIASDFPGHVDIPRMQSGRLGAAFWTVWTPCEDQIAGLPGPNFTGATNSLRDAFEMLDLIHNMIQQHPNHLRYALTAQDIRDAHNTGKIASLIGMEGTHFLGNSLAVLRIFASLGVRYLTLTHMCYSSFASSSGFDRPLEQAHGTNGLSCLGRALIEELNRLGVMVDLSHASDATAKEAIRHSKAPIIFSHSGARAIWDHPRNVPEDILDLIGDAPGQKDAVIHSVFFPRFIGPPGGANISSVADHIEHIANRIGRNRVGIGSDFDGMNACVEGLEDASRYPYLVAEMLSRGWNKHEIKGLLGENLMRIMDKVQAVKEELQQELPSTAIWEKRTDLPSVHWGGGGEHVFFPPDVRRIAVPSKLHDEL